MFKQDAAIERLLQDEQEAITRIVDDAVELLRVRRAGSEAAKAELRRRVERLSLAARLTARALTRLRLDCGNLPAKVNR
jgi:hypothetical protein